MIRCCVFMCLFLCYVFIPILAFVFLFLSGLWVGVLPKLYATTWQRGWSREREANLFGKSEKRGSLRRGRCCPCHTLISLKLWWVESLETQTQTYVGTGKPAASLAACPWAAPDKTSLRLVNKSLWHCQITSRLSSQPPGLLSVYSCKGYEWGWCLLASSVRGHSLTKSTY